MRVNSNAIADDETSTGAVEQAVKTGTSVVRLKSVLTTIGWHLVKTFPAKKSTDLPVGFLRNQSPSLGSARTRDGIAS